MSTTSKRISSVRTFGCYPKVTGNDIIPKACIQGLFVESLATVRLGLYSKTLHRVPDLANTRLGLDSKSLLRILDLAATRLGLYSKTPHRVC